MQQLLDGYVRFRSNIYPQHSNLFERLAGGQQPQALFITCADSRVHPEMVTQSEPGTLFSCRNAGNLIPPPNEKASGVAATIEYAMRVLKVADIVICGHSDCGAMKGLLESELLESMPEVRSWLEHAGPSTKWLTRLFSDAMSMSFDQKLRLLTEANVITQMQNLKMHPAVDEALRKGDVRIHGWMYDIGCGHVQRFDSDMGCFRPLLSDDEMGANVQELKIA
ncbi:MAG TPA: carbonic anhydrase [Edaphobacter sp.]